MSGAVVPEGFSPDPFARFADVLGFGLLWPLLGGVVRVEPDWLDCWSRSTLCLPFG
jgi:hypothetical protein